MSSVVDTEQAKIDQALAQLGLSTKQSQSKEDLPEVSPSGILRDYGAGVEEAALTIATLMANGQNDSIKLKATELALRVHGIFKDLDDRGAKIPQVNITINASGEAKTLLNLVMPLP